MIYKKIEIAVDGYKETADLIQQSFIRKPIQSTLTCLRMKEMEHPP